MKQQTGSFIKRNLPFILFVVLMFSFRSSVADYYHVPTGSMEPTIQVGDRIVVAKREISPVVTLWLFKVARPIRG